MKLVQPFEVPQPVKLTGNDFLLLAESGVFDHLPRKVAMLPELHVHADGLI